MIHKSELSGKKTQPKFKEKLLTVLRKSGSLEGKYKRGEVAQDFCTALYLDQCEH